MAGCSGSAGPAPSVTPTVPSPAGSPKPTTASLTPTTPTVAIEQQCRSNLVLDGRAIALTSLNPSSASSTVSLIDVTTPSDPQQLCTYPVFRWQARFISASVLGYAAYLANSNPSDGEIGTFDILRASSRTVVRWQNGGFGAGTFAWSPDGSLAYIRATAGTDAFSGAGSWELHIRQRGQDRVLTTLPGVPGRGVSADDDDTFLAFSPDGQYIALETT